jgi:hypothetical protein
MLTIVKKNDSYDAITYQLENEDNSTVDLTGASVNFVMGKKNKLITNAKATVTSATSGIVSYQLTPLDTLVSGTFLAEFVVTFANGTTKTYPSNGYITVDVEQNLDTSQNNVVLDMIATKQGDFEAKLDSILKQGTGTQVSAMNEYTWTATSGQTIFVFPTSAKYDPSAKWFQVSVGNVPIANELINRASSSQFSLIVDPSLIVAGMTVHAMWVEPIVPITGGHHITHEINGQDEINIANLRNYQELVATPLAEKAKQYSVDVKKDFGAKGDASSDDTTAIQNAINYACANKLFLYFPNGHYVVTSSLVVSNYTYIYGNNEFFNMGTSRGNASTRIISKVETGALFTSSGGVKISNFTFKNMAASDESVSNPESIVFGFPMDYGKIKNNYFYSFDKIIKGNTGFLTSIEKNMCINTKMYAIEGTITDTKVIGNYFNMSVDSVDIQTIALKCSINLSTISDNFIDFAYTGISTNYITGSKITKNNIDYCITGIAIGGAEGISIAHNAFTHCSKQYADRLNLSASNPNRTTNSWIGISVNSTIYALSIVGNNTSYSDTFCSIKNSSYYDIKSSGNTIDKNTGFENSILFDVLTSNVDNLVISEHNYKLYTTTPSKNAVYDGQFFYVNNILFRKIGGRFQVINCKLNSDLLDYSVAITVDLTDVPTRESLTLEVVTGAGFSTYSFKTYKIFKDTTLRIVNADAYEANSTIASSTVAVSGNAITISFAGSSGTPKLGYRFLNQ